MVPKKDPLAPYKSKRDFTKTPEPKDSKVKTKTDLPTFVIHKHASRQLHYDIRLEIDGVLVSWAVPKGPSLNPSDKRLAIRTEDHPLAYATFEGVIPEGLYGAGPVMVWDIGTFDNIHKSTSLQQSVKDGLLEVFLHGKKLCGKYALIKTKGNENRWLLIKMRDEYADVERKPTKTETRSALTGRSMEQILKNSQNNG